MLNSLKFLLLISFSLISFNTWAKTNLLLQCLAKEEEVFHKKKISNALYRLNQDFVNELASANDITIKASYLEEICRDKKHSPSVSLLKQLLLKELDLYDLRLTDVPLELRPFKMGYINEFQKQVPRIFVQYISSLQAEMPTADCLTKAIPELIFFYEKIKYLEEDVKSKQLISDKKKIEKVFKKLETIQNIKAGCEKSLNMKKEKNS